MSSETTPRPGVALRKAADRMLANTAEFVDDVVASDPFSKSLARGMALTAGTIAAMRRVTRSIGGLTTSWFNMPSRQQMIELQRRVIHLEMVIDDIDMRTSQILEQAGSDEPAH